MSYNILMITTRTLRDELKSNFFSKDISSLVESKPKVIIAGTGVNGLMKPESGLSDFLAKKGIEFLAAPNEKAAELYNDQAKNKKVGAGFHLFC